jgi:hypothetical protein
MGRTRNDSTNVLEPDTELEGSLNETDTAANLDTPEVDVPASEDETDAPASNEAESGATEATTKTTRAKVAEGLLTPIQFHHKLVEEGLAPKDFRTQVVYSYIKSPAKNDPFPVVESNGRPAVKWEDGKAWWERKEARRTEQAAKKAQAAAEAEAKANQPVEAEGGEVTEAESADVVAPAVDEVAEAE